MKTKTLINLFLILIIAILGILVRNSYNKYQNQKPNAYLEAISKFPKEAISKIIISQGADLLEFQKDNDIWRVNNKKAADGEVNQLINGLLPETSPVLISTTAKQLEKMNISSTSAAKITLSSGDQTLTFLAGDKSESSTPVAIDGTLEVYALKSLPDLSFDLSDWVDLNITSFNQGDISKIVFPEFNLIFSDAKWSLENSDQAIAQDSVTTYLAKLNPFKAQKIADSETLAKYNLNNPDFNLSLFGQSNTEIKLSFYKGEDEYLAKRIMVENNEEEYFVITAYQAENLNKELETFLAK